MTCEQYKKFDAAEYLETPEEIARYLELVFEDGDAAEIAAAIGVAARAKGITDIARKAGVTRRTVYKTMSGADPKLSTLLGVLNALGLRLSAAPTAAPKDAA